jgi:hypothetical protein
MHPFAREQGILLALRIRDHPLPREGGLCSFLPAFQQPGLDHGSYRDLLVRSTPTAEQIAGISFDFSQDFLERRVT